MFWIKYFFQNVLLFFRLLFRGEWRRAFRAAYARIHNRAYYVWFWFAKPFLRNRFPTVLPQGKIEVITNHPVAFSSPDHIVPYGTKYNNSTNRSFVLLMNRIIRQRGSQEPPCFMDLGCSGGQLVKDFADLRWIAVGLEGSDYSLKAKRANWRHLAGKALFTCDITKPFEVKFNGQKLKFHLITAWEVLEHIHPDDLEQVFQNIRSHLIEGGYFIASTASYSSLQDGVELHQTRKTNSEWDKFIAERYSDLRNERKSLRLQTHEYVRYDFGEESFLVYKKTPVSQSLRAAI
jgi:SAM-dependent methyltransferase